MAKSIKEKKRRDCIFSFLLLCSFALLAKKIKIAKSMKEKRR